MLSAKKVLYAILFSREGVAIEVSRKRAKALLEILQRCGTEEIEKILAETAPSHGFHACFIRLYSKFTLSVCSSIKPPFPCVEPHVVKQLPLFFWPK